MRRNRTKIAVLATALVVVAGGAAFAYWTSGGSGDGTAATGTTVGITVVQTSTPTDLRPAGAPQSLNGTFLNTNSGPVYVGTVTASISSVVKAVGAPAGACTAADYTLANPVITYNAEVLEDDSSTWTGPTIAFNNSGSNQDGCKLATVNIHYLIS
jgi:hypothetical protein